MQPILTIFTACFLLFGATVGAAEPTTRVPDRLLPFDLPPTEVLEASPRQIIAHWFLWPISIDDAPPTRDRYAEILNTGRYTWESSLRFRPLPRPPRNTPTWQLEDAKADIRLAQAMGVDAFHAIYSRSVLDHRWKLPVSLLLVRAAHELASGFEVALVISCNSCASRGPRHWTKWSPEIPAGRLLDDLEEAGLADSPALQRHAGRLVVGAWNVQAAPPDWWRGAKDVFRRRGHDVALMCIFNRIGVGGYRDDYDEVCDLWTDWGAREPRRAQRDLRAQWRGINDEIVAAAINQQDLRFRPNFSAGVESRGSATLRRNWLSAIRGGADWAHLVTWNDHGEHSSFAPNTAEQFAFFDLNLYFTTWFKMGEPPAIERDALYFFHRIHHGPPWIRLFRGARGRWINEIELVGFLEEPGVLEIATAEGMTRQAVPAGLQVLRAPLPRTGRPRFRLLRDDEVVVDVTSPFEIGRSTGTGIDLAYRAGGSLRLAEGERYPPPACAESGTAAERAAACLAPDQGEPVWLATPRPPQR
jgi:hypothetical protein